MAVAVYGSGFYGTDVYGEDSPPIPQIMGSARPGKLRTGIAKKRPPEDTD
jgi:hypothetical protein